MIIPKDIELFQCYSNNFDDLLRLLEYDEIIKIYHLLDSIFNLIHINLKKLQNTSDEYLINLYDDHLLDFVSHCMSLPRERIANLITNTKSELLNYSLYYVYNSTKCNNNKSNNTSNNTSNCILYFQNEGYLIYTIREYVFASDLEPNIDYIDYINNYTNIFY